MTTITTRIPALPKQIAFVADDTSEEILYSGAFGAGKTRAIALKVVRRAMIPGSYEGLCRKVRADLWTTTLATLLRPEGTLDPILPPGTYRHDRAHSEIHLNGGGTIHYFGFDDPQRRASLNLSGCGIEEATELSEEDWTMLLGRRRRVVPGLHRQLYAACNPSAPSHWLARRFGLAPDKTTPDHGCRVIKTRTSDNVFLPADYVASLERFTGLRRLRYVEGEWCGSDALVYSSWSRDLHVRERDIDARRVWIGVDEGYTHPFCALRIIEDEDGRLHVEEEVYETRLQRDDKVDAVLRLARGEEDVCVVVDSAAAELIDAIAHAGLNVSPAQKQIASVFDGIVHFVDPLLQDAGDGHPRLTVDPSCVSVIMEFETYEWKPNRDEPVKESDHAMDAIRYVAMIARGDVLGVAIPSLPRSSGQIPDDVETIESEYDRLKREHADAFLRGGYDDDP